MAIDLHYFIIFVSFPVLDSVVGLTNEKGKHMKWGILVFASAAFFLNRSLPAQSAGARETVIPLLGDNLFPEGIGYDQKTRTYYVGSAADGSIQAICNGIATWYQQSGTDGRTKALGIKVDSARDRIFIASGDGVYVYQLSQNLLLQKVLMAEVFNGATSALNDFAIDRAGNAYVTDSFNPHILQIDAQTLNFTVFADVSAIPFGRQNDMPYNLNGLVISKDGRELIMVKTNDGSLWRLNLLSKKVDQIELAESVFQGDGLVWGHGSKLYIIRNFINRISFIDMNQVGPKTITDISTTTTLVPTTAVFTNGKKGRLTIVNSQFGSDAPKQPFHLTEIEFSR
jgi:sugar lactone lactonase YvrE